MKETSIYLAARYGRRAELAVYADVLRMLECTVTSRWLEGKHEPMDRTEATTSERQGWALEDWIDLADADVVIAFTEEPQSSCSRGGRHVEFGAAIAWRKKCIVIGPRENVFHCMPQVDQYGRWDDFLQAYFPVRKTA